MFASFVKLGGTSWRRLAIRLAAVGLALVLLAPAGALLLSHADDTCACGMKSGCFCKLIASQGAHCSLRGGSCSMKPSHRPPDSQALFASLDLRGWLIRPVAVAEAHRDVTDLSPAASCRLPRSLARRPEIPPPRSFQIA
jgi:hypothetical protein